MVDRAQPITAPKATEECIRRWSAANSRFRKVLEVTPGVEPPRTLKDIIDDWARSSGHGDRGDRLKFGRVHLFTSDRLLELLRRSLRKDSQASIAFSGLVSLVQTLSERATVVDPELREMVRPVVERLPEAAIFRVAELMWEEWITENKETMNESNTANGSALSSPTQVKQSPKQAPEQNQPASAATATDSDAATAMSEVAATAVAAVAAVVTAAVTDEPAKAASPLTSLEEIGIIPSLPQPEAPLDQTVLTTKNPNDQSAVSLPAVLPAMPVFEEDQDSAMSESEPSDHEH
ncbi:hypothetical protein BDF19DRAFT_201847 [Syncephalis fuscata]|nr:hypothetical protein BDF19DRAFT_201847 [Syncephalis fuscata]